MVFLRKIRKAKWYRNQNVPWLGSDDLQADTLGDLETKDNKLSVYQISNSNENLEQVVVAIALTCDHITNVDYALINEEDLDSLKLKCVRTNGDTPDENVNLLHYDLVEITANKILDLAYVIKRSEINRLTEKRVKQIAANALNQNSFDRTKINLKTESRQSLEALAERLRK